jgi:hypothetical protein
MPQTKPEEISMSSDNQWTALGPAAIGFQTDASRIAYGVNVQGTTAGVYGESLANSPGSRQAPTGTGVCGLGDIVGVIGQGDPDGPVPTAPELQTGVMGLGGDIGVSGTGDSFGVQGQSFFEDAEGSKGTGVQGTSNQGVGVWGVSSGDVGGQIPPYIGVFGSAQFNSSDPYPVANFDRNRATGVLGIGDNYGGAFQATPQLDPFAGKSPTFANVQLTPIDLPDNPESAPATRFPPQKPPIAPDLPLVGQPGDMIMVNQTGRGVQGAQLWVCLRPPPGSRPAGTLWARVTFDYLYETRPMP